MADTTFEALKAEYAKLWGMMVVTKPTSVNTLAKKFYANKGRYLIVEKQTGVPWFVVAALHNRESSGNFGTQLAQGDPLNKKSTHIPKGRGPFQTWEDGAYDALVTLKGLNKITDWSPARICYEVERYNGFGYRNYHPNVLAPYLWSFSGYYITGKYVSDGRFDVKAVDQQCGAIPLIKRLIELDSEATAPLPTPAGLPQKVTTPVSKPAEKPLTLLERFKAWFA